MTIKEAIEALPRDGGWYVSPTGTIRRVEELPLMDDQGRVGDYKFHKCPLSYLFGSTSNARGVMLVEGQARWGLSEHDILLFMRAADGYFVREDDHVAAAIRLELLNHLGLVEGD